MTGADWRMIDGVWTAWFEGTSLSQGAAAASAILERTPGTAIDLRTTGIRVCLDVEEDSGLVSAAARHHGLIADPAVLQRVAIAFESPNQSGLVPFWQRALDYVATPTDGLVDPLRRDPSIRIDTLSKPRPLRNRIHVDVVRPAPQVQAAGLGEATGPYGVCHSDPDGNEVDLVPGDPLANRTGVANWHSIFSAMACYRVTSPAQQSQLAARAAAQADDAGFPLLIDLRPGLVILDSGKDQSDADAHGLPMDFTDLAEAIQGVARGLGATADPGLPRFVQLVLDAADVAAVRAFWVGALGYHPDRRTNISDVYDPRRLGPVLVFQELDPLEAERRRQRNRIRIELSVPADQAARRLAEAVAAGGRLLEHLDDGAQVTVVDPEGNELVIVHDA